MKNTLPNTLVVSVTESGQKLLQFLRRRLCLPPALLHRWIRTGQTRVNGSRCKAFTRLAVNDAVRLPPFAADMALQSGAQVLCDVTDAPLSPPEPYTPSTSQFLATVGVAGNVWAVFKPAGLPTHPGTGHSDSLTTRLAQRYANAAFTPTPAHRLDKDTSGILLVAASFAALRATHNALRERALSKEYVVRVHGRWPYDDVRELRHYLGKTPDTARWSICSVKPLMAADAESLLLIRLVTGRTHQIRLQTAHLGHPVVGDIKYGSSHKSGILYLHALRVLLPDKTTFSCLPEWPAERALNTVPQPLFQ